MLQTHFSLPHMDRHLSISWISMILGIVLGEALLILAFMFVLEHRVPLRWTVALCPFAAGLWVLMRLVVDPLVPDAQPFATDLLRTTALLTAGCAAIASAYIFFFRPGLV